MNALLLAVTLAAASPSPVAKANFDRGEKALESQQYDVAIAAYQEALKATPGWAPALNGMGSALFKQGKRDEAIAQFKAATEADPTFKLAWFNMGYSSRKTSDFKTAAAAYEQYTKLDANDPDGFYGLGESYRQLGDSAKAIAAYEEYLKKEKRPTEQKWVDKAKEFITTLRAATQNQPVAAKQPDPAPAAKQADPQPATNTAQPAGQPIPAAAARRTADGDKFMSEKKYREASFAYADAVHADPSNVEARFKLGNTYAVLGYYAQAIDQWNAVAQLTQDPSVKKSAQDNIARAQTKMASAGGSPQAAGKPPGTGPVADSTRTQARGYYEQGVKQIAGRDYGNALSSLSAALQLEPALTVGYVARGSALIGLRRFQEAAVDYQYALKLDPNMASPLYGLAEAYTGMNRPTDAKQYYEKYVASTANDVRPELQSDARAKLDRLR
ncbi:MAG: tetratricopeptide repeat protein [Myxococcaceae bacterium]|nr:tetratricopeptide repeat protein [Myxococcaceae bacterium]